MRRAAVTGTSAKMSSAGRSTTGSAPTLPHSIASSISTMYCPCASPFYALPAPNDSFRQQCRCSHPAQLLTCPATGCLRPELQYNTTVCALRTLNPVQIFLNAPRLGALEMACILIEAHSLRWQRQQQRHWNRWAKYINVLNVYGTTTGIRVHAKQPFSSVREYMNCKVRSARRRSTSNIKQPQEASAFNNTAVADEHDCIQCANNNCSRSKKAARGVLTSWPEKSKLPQLALCSGRDTMSRASIYKGCSLEAVLT
jgi:hypothetical protein